MQTITLYQGTGPTGTLHANAQATCEYRGVTWLARPGPLCLMADRPSPHSPMMTGAIIAVFVFALVWIMRPLFARHLVR